MKKRTTMRWWHDHHPLGSRSKWVRYAWLILSMPLQIVLFPANAIFHGVIAFSSEFFDVMKEWSRSVLKAWRDTGSLGRSDDD